MNKSMQNSKPHLLLLEPYYGGSHQAFLEGMQKNLSFNFTLVSLPARKWKMRMQLAAPWMADHILRLLEEGNRYDAILCSTFIDVATLRVLLAKAGIFIPVGVYFHENQFAYPNQVNDPSIFQFTALNFTSALAADSLAFNSQYNLDTFLNGVGEYLAKATDMVIAHKIDELRRKSIILYPGIDFSDFDQVKREKQNEFPVIVWNHRWEHDKGPETFFQALFRLSEEGCEFRLIVLGQHFERCPEIFHHAKTKLAEQLLHFGFTPDKNEYVQLLHQGDIVVSTAVHEFFGMAVLEAVRCGCRPMVPARLSYMEIFPEKYRYNQDEFYEQLSLIVYKSKRLDADTAHRLTERYSWNSLKEKYKHWLFSLSKIKNAGLKNTIAGH